MHASKFYDRPTNLANAATAHSDSSLAATSPSEARQKNLSTHSTNDFNDMGGRPPRPPLRATLRRQDNLAKRYPLGHPKHVSKAPLTAETGSMIDSSMSELAQRNKNFGGTRQICALPRRQSNIAQRYPVGHPKHMPRDPIPAIVAAKTQSNAELDEGPVQFKPLRRPKNQDHSEVVDQDDMPAVLPKLGESRTRALKNGAGPVSSINAALVTEHVEASSVTDGGWRFMDCGGWNGLAKHFNDMVATMNKHLSCLPALNCFGGPSGEETDGCDTQVMDGVSVTVEVPAGAETSNIDLSTMLPEAPGHEEIEILRQYRQEIKDLITRFHNNETEEGEKKSGSSEAERKNFPSNFNTNLPAASAAEVKQRKVEGLYGAAALAQARFNRDETDRESVESICKESVTEAGEHFDEIKKILAHAQRNIERVAHGDAGATCS